MRVSQSPHHIVLPSLDAQSLELESSFASLGASIHVTEIIPFQAGSLAYSATRGMGLNFFASFSSPALKRFATYALPFLASLAESFMVVGTQRLFSNSENSDDFIDSWKHSAVQISLLRGLNAYFPCQSMMMRHLSADAAMLLSREVFSEYRSPLLKSLLEIEAQNWNWSLGHQAFLRLSGSRISTLERKWESLGDAARYSQNHSFLSFANPRKPYGVNEWISFGHPQKIDLYLREHGIDSRCVEVNLQTPELFMSGVWAYSRNAMRDVYERSSRASFSVCIFDIHPVPEFAHLRPVRLVEEVLPVLESSPSLVRRFPGRILRTSLLWMSENTPMELYRLRRKTEQMGFPLSRSQDADLHDWMMREMPKSPMPCVGVLLRLNHWDPPKRSAPAEAPLASPAKFFQSLHGRHFSPIDLCRRHDGIMAERPRDLLALTRHLEDLRNWVLFLSQHSLLHSRLQEVRTHLRELMTEEAFSSPAHFRSAADVLLMTHEVEWSEMSQGALFPLVSHRWFSPRHYDALFSSLREANHGNQKEIDRLYEHGVQLYVLTGNFHLKEAFENEIRRSRGRHAERRAIEFAGRIRQISLRP